ncbi:uncharacterized protein LOC135389504 [Ornithodoros turicata]|uniref:uncharacterized protein LOC135389504 n=1 Tax=Ornithodoros turicata TaxID=34597 RepID=UPI003139DB07
MSSVGVPSTARPSRDYHGFNDTLRKDDYRLVLPTLPRGKFALYTVALHADLLQRPYRREDFKPALKTTLNPEDIASFGVYQMNHVWVLTTRSAQAKQKLLEIGECSVKGRKCLILDTSPKEVRAKLHWIPFHTPDEEVRMALSPFGSDIVVKREVWNDDFFKNTETTERTVTMRLKDGVSVDNIPHQLRILGNLTLVSIAGRPPLCLRCRQTGHIRRQCRTPKCEACRRFGHDKDSCLKTYADRTKVTVEDNHLEDLIMDVAETAATSQEAKDDSQRQPQGRPAMREHASDSTCPNDLIQGQSQDRGHKQVTEGDKAASAAKSIGNNGNRTGKEPDVSKAEAENTTAAPADTKSGNAWKMIPGKRTKIAKPKVPYDPRDRGQAQN